MPFTVATPGGGGPCRSPGPFRPWPKPARAAGVAGKAPRPAAAPGRIGGTAREGKEAVLHLRGESLMLTTLGLDADAEAVYRAMLARPKDGVAALGQALGLTQDQVRAALDTLSELALV